MSNACVPEWGKAYRQISVMLAPGQRLAGCAPINRNYLMTTLMRLTTPDESDWRGRKSAMCPDTFLVELERGSGPQYPYGDFGSRFQLFLPRRADGGVDTDALRHGSEHYRGVRLRAGDGEANGRIVLDSIGRFVLQYDDLRFYPTTLFFGSGPLAVGSLMRIAEYAEKPRDYRVVSMRQVAPPLATAGARP
jgi:hypothetical protein